MDFDFEPRQRSVRDTAREVARDLLRPQVDRRDREHTFPEDTLRAMADRGLMGVNVSENWGGMGSGVVSYSLAITEIARADAAVAVTMAVNNMVAEIIEIFGTESQKEAHLANLTGGVYSSGSFCLSEPGAGSDPAGMRTRAIRTDDGWRINGTKAWITSGEFAGVYVVWAQTEVGGEDRISAFLVDPNTPGISAGKPEKKMGQHGSNTVALTFEDVDVPAEAILGEVGGGFKIAMVALDGGRVGVASQALGIGIEAVEVTRSHTRENLEGAERTKALDRLSALYAELEAARLLVLRAAWMKEQKAGRFTREASMAKLYASEASWNACVEALDIAGLEAHRRGLPLERCLRDCRVTRIYEGTSEIQRIVIARDLLRRGVKAAIS
ncbi:MAG: acyl-CoA dehydrogenase family protein [Myxococcota bacterium]